MSENQSPIKPLQFDDESVVYSILKPLLLEASAGSGKTTILVERYFVILIYQLLFENQIEASFYETLGSIVALTYTRKAASEMKDRLRSKIEEGMNQENILYIVGKIEKYTGKSLPEKNSRIKRLLERKNGLADAFSSVSISTIHSFGLEILRSNPVESGIDPAASPEDDSGIEELSITSKDALFNTLRQLIDSSHPDFTEITGVLGFKKTKEILIEIFNLCKTSGFIPLEKQFKEAGYLDDSGLSLDSSVQKQAYPALQRIREELLNQLELNKRSQTAINTAINDIDQFFMLRDPRAAYSSNLCYGGSGSSAEAVEGLYRELYSQLNRVLFPYIWRVTALLYKNYEQLKRTRLEITFSDIELKLFDVLKADQSLRDRLKKKIRFIMIDEYQDTSDIQKSIFDQLIYTDDGKLAMVPFVVGDPKQSIYGFRNANVGIFARTKREFAGIHPESVKLLNINYRSDMRVITAVNSIFSGVFAAGKVEYHLQEGSKDSGNDEKGVYFIPEEGESAHEAFESSCKSASGIITRLVSSGDYRPADIIVLLRKKSRLESLNRIFTENLGQAGIPFYQVDTSNVLETREIQDLILYLKALDNRENNYFFLPLMKTPFFRKSDPEIYHYSRLNMSLYQSLEEEGSPEIAVFKSLYRIKNQLTIPGLVEEIINRTGYSAFLNMQPNRKELSTNLIVFLDYLRKIQNVELFRLTDFLYYLQEYGAYLSKPQVVGEKSDVVRIMTVHAAKGLEAKVVIYIATTAKRNNNGWVLSHNGKAALNLSGEDALCLNLSSDKELMEAEEEKRLAYVAFTRAKDVFYYAGLSHTAGRNERGVKLDKNEKDGTDGWKQFIHDEKGFAKERLYLAGDAGLPGYQYQEKREGILLKTKEKLEFLEKNEHKLKFNKYPKMITITQLLDIEFLEAAFNQRYLYRSFPVEEALNEIAAVQDPFFENTKRADLGTYLHQVFQYASADNYQEYIRNTMPFDAAEMKGIMEKAGLFYESGFYRDVIAASARTVPEWEFNYPLDWGNERMIIKGTVDKYLTFQDGTAAIIDYKLTVHKDRSRYERQLNYYSYILEQIGYPSDKLYLYDIEANLAIEVNKNTGQIPGLLEDQVRKICGEFEKF